MAQVMKNASDALGAEKVLAYLSRVADHALEEDQYLLLLQLLSTAIANLAYAQTPVMEILKGMGGNLPVNNKRNESWDAWESMLTMVLESGPTEKADELLASIRVSSWRMGYPSHVIDRLINLASTLGPAQDDLRHRFLLSAGEIIRQRNKDRGMMRLFLEVQYIANHIAASGDLIGAWRVLSQVVQDAPDIRNKTTSPQASYIKRRLQLLQDGMLKAISLIKALSPSSLEEAVSLYRSPDCPQVPPVYIIARGLRQNASVQLANRKRSRDSVAEIHKAVQEMMDLRILTPIFSYFSKNDEAALTLHHKFLTALKRGDDFSTEDWSGLLTETMDFLKEKDCFLEAYDLLKIFHEMGVCETRVFSNLATKLATEVGTLLNKPTPLSPQYIADICDRLAAWGVTLN
jgi:hypothetical protein